MRNALTRCFSQTTNRQRMDYVDKWHASIVKPPAFYEMHASGEGFCFQSNSDSDRTNDQEALDKNRRILKQRRYFYSVDLQGRVFLEETLPKNIATSLKSPAFLNEFYRRLRRIRHEERAPLASKYHSHFFQASAEEDYPYVSSCGPAELNYVRPADCAIVFHSLLLGEEESTMKEQNQNKRRQQQQLVFAATLTQPFDPAMLAISKLTGRLYHRLTTFPSQSSFPTLLHKHSFQNQQNSVVVAAACEYGLFKSSLAVSLSEHIVPSVSQTLVDHDYASFADDNNACDEHERQQQQQKQQRQLESQEFSGMDYVCPTTGTPHPIAFLPQESEPGSWSIPPEEHVHS